MATAALVSLTGVKPRRITGLMVIALHPAGQSFSAVTALEYLEPMRAFPPVLRAHLAFFEDRLTDLGPEVPGATQACGAVWRAETDRTFLPWCTGNNSKGTCQLLSHHHFRQIISESNLHVLTESESLNLPFVWYIFEDSVVLRGYPSKVLWSLPKLSMTVSSISPRWKWWWSVGMHIPERVSNTD